MRAARRFRIWRNRIRAIVRKEELDQDLDQELAFHLEQLTAENIADGMSRIEARQAARRIFGNVGALAEESRDQRRMNWLNDAMQDVAYGWRMLRGNLRFTIVAAASLALGIGANTAILSALDTVFRADLPLPDADRLVLIRAVPRQNPENISNSTVPEYLAWKRSVRSYSNLGLSIANFQDLSMTEDGAPPERITGQAVTFSLLQTLGVAPALGRVFTEEEASVDAPARVIILSHRLWQRRFRGDPTIVDRQIRMDGRWNTIIGVMPEGFWYPHPAVDYWVPLGMTAAQKQASGRLFAVTARLKDGIPRERADAELALISTQLQREFPEREGSWGARTQPIREHWFGWLRQPLLILEGAGLLILMIACANVATLLVARATVRRPEFAMRAALGAGHGRIFRQLLAESVLLSGIGGVLGLAVAWLVSKLLNGMQPPPGGISLPAMALNPVVFALEMVIALVCGLTFGILPAFTGLAGAKSLHEQAKRPGRERFRGTLVAAQVGLALILLIGSGLLIQSLQHLVDEDRGYEPEGLLTFEFRIPQGEYLKQAESFHGMPAAEVRPPMATMQRVYDRLWSLPGVTSIGGISQPIVNGILVPTFAVMREDRPTPETASEREALLANYFIITPNLLATLRGKIVHGRDITTDDTASSPWVAIINESAARQYWPGEDPIGKRFMLDVAEGERQRVVIGVVHDITTNATEGPHRPSVYTSYLQQPEVYRGFNGNMFGQMVFALRGPGDVSRLIPAARQAVAEVDPNHPISNATSIVWWGGFVMINRGLYFLVLGTFAFVATLLATMGIYGVTAYAVSQRTREIAIRMSVGARESEIGLLLCRRAMMLIGIGLGGGLIGAWMFAGLLRTQMWRMTTDDPLTFIAAAVFLAIVALIATLIPARKAMQVNPSVALRSE